MARAAEAPDGGRVRTSADRPRRAAFRLYCRGKLVWAKLHSMPGGVVLVICDGCGEQLPKRLAEIGMP